MIKTIAIIAINFGLVACSDRQSALKALQSRADSLQQQINNSYKPGFGEFMSSIQVHHEKLWFAGLNKNWALAGFEMGEIREALAGIQAYCSDRPERKSMPMIDAPLDSIGHAIRQQDVLLFKNSFITLTHTCNNCHQATEHAFNVIKLPDNPPFSNQVFTPAEDKK